MFAGPNGSGKSTLIYEIGLQFKLGYLINADDIESDLNTKHYIDCSTLFPRSLYQIEWLNFLEERTGDPRFQSYNFQGIHIRNNYLISAQKINSYQAALIAEFFREKLCLENHTFSFETVMSHKSKLDFMRKAKDKGFKVYLYFICTQDPEINKQRVKNRMIKGGHNVPENKVEERYYRSLELLSDAFLMADRTFILDSSNKNRDVIIEKKDNEIIVHQQYVPEWIGLYVLDKL